MSAVLLSGVVAASFLGSLHCVGMCGPFAGVVAGVGSGDRGRLQSHTAYHLGRLLTYAALGVAAGAVGSAVDLAGSAAGVARVSAVVAGFSMMAMGLCALLETQGLRVLPARATGGLGAWLGRALARLDSAPRGLRALVVGLSTTLLPCGWLYAFAVTAAGTGSVLGGVSVMAAFWLGSVPLLLAAGVGLRALSARLSRHVPVLTALLLIGVGLCLVVARINAPSLAVELLLTPDAPAAAAGQAKGCPLHGH